MADASPMSLPTTPAALARFIDHTLTRADATIRDIEKLCVEAREYKFHSVSVNGSWVAEARHFLDGSDVKVGCAVGFPLGAMSGDVKRFEAEAAIDDGAHEIDVDRKSTRLNSSHANISY